MNISGLLIVNADDWGRDRENTNRTLDCILSGAVSSASAMVFMEDSERAAAIAKEKQIDAGLHLNLTTPFSGPGVPSQLVEHQARIAHFLRRSRLAPVVFHPGLIKSFEYTVAAQLAEFCRIYGEEPRRVDGHHHMHLSSNVLLSKLIPPGTTVRRNFTFRRGEKGFVNRMYRRFVDDLLKRRHCLTDYFFALPPLQSDRLRRIFSLAERSVVEVETHPIDDQEYRFLTQGQIFHLAGDVKIARRYVPLPNDASHRSGTGDAKSVGHPNQSTFSDLKNQAAASEPDHCS